MTPAPEKYEDTAFQEFMPNSRELAGAIRLQKMLSPQPIIRFVSGRNLGPFSPWEDKEYRVENPITHQCGFFDIDATIIAPSVTATDCQTRLGFIKIELPKPVDAPASPVYTGFVLHPGQHMTPFGPVDDTK